MRRAVPPEEYWPVLLGEGFRPMAHMEFVWRWRRRWPEIAAALDQPVDALDDERTYHPEAIDMRGAFLALPAKSAERAIEALPAYAQLWAFGFMHAVENWPEEWQPPRDRDAAEMMHAALHDIVSLAEADTGAPTVSMYAEDGPPSVSNERLDAWAPRSGRCTTCARSRAAWGRASDPVRKAAEPGRNDPCPCGSGKKYKKCHGAG